MRIASGMTGRKLFEDRGQRPLLRRRAMQLNWRDGAAWAGIAALVGALLGQFLSSGQLDSVEHWGGVVGTVAAAVAGAATAFVLALRKK